LGIGYFYTVLSMAFDPSRDYPLGSNAPRLVQTPGGIPLAELDLHDDSVTAAELRATPATLRLQAEVARANGQEQLAQNLIRAAELAPLPDDTILAIYTALRPGRSTAPELEEWARRLEEWDAPATAAFVREAAGVYERRQILAI
jgi:propanediol dehydratase small subunit